LTLSKTGTGTGSVTSTPAGISCGATCSASFAGGTAVTLTATPDAGSTLAGWTGCDSATGNQCSVTMNGAKTVSATFNKAQYALDVAVTGGGSGTVASTPAGVSCPGTCQALFDPVLSLP
jgi:hypothetical protein